MHTTDGCPCLMILWETCFAHTGTVWTAARNQPSSMIEAWIHVLLTSERVMDLDLHEPQHASRAGVSVSKASKIGEAGWRQAVDEQAGK